MSTVRILKPFWLRAVALVALSVVMALLAWWPMVAAYPNTPELDGRYAYHQLEIGKAAVRTYGELPLWNPFDCRGIPFWDHPETIAVSPLLLALTSLNTTISYHIWNLFHAAVGFLGMWLLARHEFKVSRTGAMIAAAMWAFAVCHTSQYAGAHETLVSFYNAPLLLLLWRRAEHSWNAAIGVGLILAWMLYEGATYPLPHSVAMLGVETLTRLWPKKRIPRVLGSVVVVGVVLGLVGASRLLPLMEQLATHKRVMHPDTDHLLRWNTLRAMYTLRAPEWYLRLPGQQYVWGEYIAYIGFSGVFIVLLGVAAAGAEFMWAHVVAGFLFVVMLGHFASWAPWTVLHEHVFPFKVMRVPARFRLLLAMFFAAYAALAVDRLPKQIGAWFGKPRFGHAIRIGLVGLALLGAGDAMGLGLEIVASRFKGAPPQPVKASPHFYYGGPGLAHDSIDQPRQNRAYLGCRAEFYFHEQAALWEGDVPQARALDENTVVVEKTSRTHNTFTIDVDAKAPGRIVLNSAYDQGWQSTVGSVVVDRDLLAVDVPAGKSHVFVKYWPKKLTLGFTLSAIGLLGSLLFFARGLWLPLLKKRTPA